MPAPGEKVALVYTRLLYEYVLARKVKEATGEAQNGRVERHTPIVPDRLASFLRCHLGGGQMLAGKHLAGKQIQNAARALPAHNTADDNANSTRSKKNANRAEKPPASRIMRRNGEANKTRKGRTSSNNGTLITTCDFGRCTRSRSRENKSVRVRTKQDEKLGNTLGNPRASQMYKTRRCTTSPEQTQKKKTSQTNTTAITPDTAATTSTRSRTAENCNKHETHEKRGGRNKINTPRVNRAILT